MNSTPHRIDRSRVITLAVVGGKMISYQAGPLSLINLTATEAERIAGALLVMTRGTGIVTLDLTANNLPEWVGRQASKSKSKGGSSK